MTKNKLKFSAYLFIAIILSLGLSISFQSLLADFTPPSNNPPTCPAGDPGCDVPLSVGPSNQQKQGMLLLNTAGNTNGLIVQSGNVGIGTVTPGVKLHVNGITKTQNLYHNVLQMNFTTQTSNGIKIKTNIPFPGGEMPTIKIEGYDYRAGRSLGILLVWYGYVASNSFISYSASSFGGQTPTIKLGVESGKVVIHIANDKSDQYYNRFNVSVFDTSLPSSYYNGWTWADEALTGTNIVTVPYKNRVGDLYADGNIGIGTISPGQKLDVRGNIDLTGDVYMDNNKAIRIDSATHTNLILGNFNDGGFAYGGTYNLNLAVEGDVKANRFCIGDADCKSDWTSIGGASGWTDDGTTVRLTTISDNVGIGTATPNRKLDVAGLAQFDDTSTYTTYGWTGSTVQANSIEILDKVGGNVSDGIYPTLVFHDYGAGGAQFTHEGSTKILHLASGASNSAGTLQTGSTYFSEFRVHGKLTTTGNVGIGTNAPGQLLDVRGNIDLTGDVYMDNNKAIRIDSAAHTNLILGNFNDGAFAYGGTYNLNLAVEGDVKANRFCIGDADCKSDWTSIGGASGWTDDGTTVRLTTVSDNVGIGTATPSEKLHVNGNIKVANNQLVTGTGFKKTITSSMAEQVVGRYYDIATFQLTELAGFIEIKLTIEASAVGLSYDYVFAPSYVFSEYAGSTAWHQLVPVRKFERSGNIADEFTVAVQWAGSHNFNVRVIKTEQGGSYATNSRDIHVVIKDPTGGLYYITDTSGTGTMTIPTDLIYGGPHYNVNTGNFGIGTKAPGAKLDVYGTNNKLRLSYDSSNYVDLSATSAGYIYFQPSGARTYFNKAGADNSFYVYDYRDDSSTYMTFSALNFSMQDSGTIINRLSASGSSYINGGNVGIGTSAPGSKLEVNGNIAAINSNPLIFLGPSNGSATTANYHSIGYAQSDGYHVTGSGAGDLTIGALGGENIVFGTNTSGIPTTRMYIKNDGNVGIGTTAPGYKLHVNGTVFASEYFGGACDIAERYNADDEEKGDLEPGDILSLSRSGDLKVGKSKQAYDTMVIGVFSTDPMLTMGEFEDSNNEDNPPVALLGRVPTKVTNENGAIEIGDLIVSSSKEGHGMKCDEYSKCQGAVVGKALENFNGEEGVIEVLINVGM